MTCAEIELLLDDYVDGALAAEEVGSIESHLGSCLSCNRALKQIRALVDRARGLPAEIEPFSDLWPGIESRISAGSAARHPRQWRPWTRSLRWSGLAAAALLLVLAPLTVRMRQGGGEAAMEARAMLARSEDGVLLPKTDLVETLERHRGILDPEVVAAMERGAREIDTAIGQIREALGQNPGDRRLQLLLASRYQQEVDLLKRVSRV